MLKHLVEFRRAGSSTTAAMMAQTWHTANEVDKLACEPCLTTRCVGAMTPIAIEQQLCIWNLVLLKPCDFLVGLTDSSFMVTRQSWGTLRCARLDSLFWNSHLTVRPMKDLWQVDAIFRVDT
jgi:hypothetical protein